MKQLSFEVCCISNRKTNRAILVDLGFCAYIQIVPISAIYPNRRGERAILIGDRGGIHGSSSGPSDVAVRGHVVRAAIGQRPRLLNRVGGVRGVDRGNAIPQVRVATGEGEGIAAIRKRIGLRGSDHVVGDVACHRLIPIDTARIARASLGVKCEGRGAGMRKCMGARLPPREGSAEGGEVALGTL